MGSCFDNLPNIVKIFLPTAAQSPRVSGVGSQCYTGCLHAPTLLIGLEIHYFWNSTRLG